MGNVSRNIPSAMEIRGARVHNLKSIDIDIPLQKLVGIAGVSGSGKSSLALGVLYAEGSRRYLEALSTYTRRRMTMAAEADIDSVEYVPAALALHQRPAMPNVRSTFGTSTELLNSLRLMFSRLGSHCCPNGHLCAPSMNVALEQPITCPECGEQFFGPGAEMMAFNSEGACPTCQGTGIVREVDISTLVPDESKTIDEGAVVVWGSLMWSLMKDICREMGVRTDVPFCELTDEERDIVYHGPADKKHILYYNEKTGTAGEMDFTYFNAIYTVENALSKVKDEKGLARVARFLREAPCPDCGGTRLSAQVRSTKLRGINLAQATAMTLDDALAWVRDVPASCPPDLQDMAKSICGQFEATAKRLLDLGLGYLSLDRAATTLSTGERQRVQLARAVRNRTTGVLYVLDEPSIGLHPSNIDGLLGVVDDLLDHGNSVVLVDHDVRMLREADWLVEMGPGAGSNGGTVVAQGTVADVSANPYSLIAPFLSGAERAVVRKRTEEQELFAQGAIYLRTGQLHTVQPLELMLPKGRLTAVTGVSGSGKTTLVLESLIPALQAEIDGAPLPAHVVEIDAPGIRKANLIDATPIGANVRSTVATYSNVMDDLRKLFAKTADAKDRGLKVKDFSYNTGSLRCPDCDGTGQISLDVQFLPDVDIVCPTCRGNRYRADASDVRYFPKVAAQAGKRASKAVESDTSISDSTSLRTTAEVRGVSLPQLMSYTVDEALDVFCDVKGIAAKLRTLSSLGLGYLTLGEGTPALSGGEAQRLKLASEMGRTQEDAVFVFDEPTIGLHPLDVRTLVDVFCRLIDAGATVVVIEHDLDMIANADYVVDMGPGGGVAGGRIVTSGTPEQVAACPESITGRYLAEALR